MGRPRRIHSHVAASTRLDYSERPHVHPSLPVVRIRHLGLVGLALILAVALLATGLAVTRPAPVTVTLKAAPLGHISPEGEIRTVAGASLTVTAWADDPDLEAWLVVDGRSIRPTRTADGRYTYTFAVPGDIGVQASFIQLGDQVRLLTPSAGAGITSVSESLDEVVITGAKDFVSTLAVDDILTNTVDSGFAGRLTVRILAIEHDGPRTVLQTEPVPFSAAIVKGSIRAEIPLRLTPDPPGRPTGLIRTSVAMADDVANAGFSLNLEHTFRADNDAGGAKAVVRGNVTMTLMLQIAIDIEPKACLCLPPVQGEVRLLEIAVAETASATASVDADAHLNLAQAVQILERTFPGGFVTVIFVEPQIELGMGVDIEADGALAVQASATETLRVGLRFEDDKWSPINEFNSNAHGSVTVDATARARVFPTVRLGATIDRLCTPYVGFQPGFVELVADIGASPWWTLDAGISASAGIDCDLLVTQLQWSMDEAELARIAIADAGGPLVAAAQTDLEDATPVLPLTADPSSPLAEPSMEEELSVGADDPDAQEARQPLGAPGWDCYYPDYPENPEFSGGVWVSGAPFCAIVRKHWADWPDVYPFDQIGWIAAADLSESQRLAVCEQLILNENGWESLDECLEQNFDGEPPR